MFKIKINTFIHYLQSKRKHINCFLLVMGL